MANDHNYYAHCHFQPIKLGWVMTFLSDHWFKNNATTPCSVELNSISNPSGSTFHPTSPFVPLNSVAFRSRSSGLMTFWGLIQILICAMVKSRYIGDGHPTFNRNPYNGYINPYYWVDDHPLLYGNIGSLDPSTYDISPTKSSKNHSLLWLEILIFWVPSPPAPFMGIRSVGRWSFSPN